MWPISERFIITPESRTYIVRFVDVRFLFNPLSFVHSLDKSFSSNLQVLNIFLVKGINFKDTLYHGVAYFHLKIRSLLLSDH